jgi:hypothetical protein
MYRSLYRSSTEKCRIIHLTKQRAEGGEDRDGLALLRYFPFGLGLGWMWPGFSILVVGFTLRSRSGPASQAAASTIRCRRRVGGIDPSGHASINQSVNTVPSRIDLGTVGPTLAARLGVELAEESDLDFLVEFASPPSGGYADAYFGLVQSLEELFGKPVDLVVSSTIRNPFFLQSLERTRTLLYAA